MPLTLNVGLSRKIGLPDYSSVGADCHLAVELDAGLLADPAALAQRIAQAQAIVAQAVDAELARLHAPRRPGRPAGTNGTNGAANPPRVAGTQPRVRWFRQRVPSCGSATRIGCVCHRLPEFA